MPTFSIQTLGCRVNQADSEQLRQILLGAGFDEVSPGEPADCAIVNTCTVTGEADRKSRQFLRRAARQAPTVVATGCAVAGRGGVQSLPAAVLRLPPERREGLLELLGAQGCPGAGAGSQDRGFRQARSRALLKVQEGCDEFCSFCIVPYVRGRSRSLAVPELVARARSLEVEGYREIVLTGIHLALWGRDLDGRPDLADLLEALLEGTREVRYRLSSIEPMHFPARLLDRMAAESRRLCPHLHLALQHASNPVLQRMRRNYTLEEYDGLARRFLARVPGAVLTTDVLVGFPGETEADFQALMAYLRTVPFLHLHVFPYSPRRGTAAALFPGQVAEAEKKRRVEAVNRLGQRLGRVCRRSFRGQVRPVLVERRDPGCGQVAGTSDNFLPVVFPGGPELLGRVIPVRLGPQRGSEVLGRALGEESGAQR